MVVVNFVGGDSRRSQAWARIEHRRLSNQVQVVPQTEIQDQVIAHAPFVLAERGILLKIRIRRRTGSALPRESLHEPVGCIGSGEACGSSAVQVAAESFQAVERVGSREIAREEIRDPVHHDVEARLDGVPPVSPRRILVKRGLKKFRPTTKSVTPPWKIVASGLMLLESPGSSSRV